MSHIEAGRKAGLRFGQAGELYVRMDVLNETEKISESVEFLIDTGFNGYIQLTEGIVAALKLQVTNKDKTTVADGREVEVGVLKTKVKLLDQEISNFPIQVVKTGATLIGTRLLRDTNRMLVINYQNEIATITADPVVKKKVHKTVEKYAK